MIGKILLAMLVLAFIGQSLHFFEDHDNLGVANGAII